MRDIDFSKLVKDCVSLNDWGILVCCHFVEPLFVANVLPKTSKTLQPLWSLHFKGNGPPVYLLSQDHFAVDRHSDGQDTGSLSHVVTNKGSLFFELRWNIWMHVSSIAGAWRKVMIIFCEEVQAKILHLSCVVESLSFICSCLVIVQNIQWCPFIMVTFRTWIYPCRQPPCAKEFQSWRKAPFVSWSIGRPRTNRYPFCRDGGYCTSCLFRSSLGHLLSIKLIGSMFFPKRSGSYTY